MTTTSSSAAVLRPWDAPEITGWRRLPMSARPLQPDGEHRVALDGTWRFELFPSPEEALQHTGPLASQVQVPGLWTREQFDDVHDVHDLPHYTNIQMPFAGGGRPPRPPADNPTGVYEREIDVPASWAGRRVVLHVGAAESVLIAQIDGVDVGIGKDSHLSSEFDVTDVVLPGQRSTIRLTVVKWSDATYIEDQDQWWHGGISRPVLLYSLPPTHLSDVQVDARADGAISVRASVASPTPLAAGWSVRARIFDGDGQVAAMTSQVFPDEQVDVPKAQGPADPRVQDEAMGAVYRVAAGMEQDDNQRAVAAMVRLWRRDCPSRWAAMSGRVEDVRPWSAEIPTLYALTVTLVDPAGETVDETSLQIGFRTVEIVGRDLIVNGVRPFLRGVNRHDFHPRTGRVLTAEDIWADLALMKRFGFNAVRTSHYPNDPALYDAADALGLFVIDEADIECHAYAHEIPHDPAYRQAFVERVARMVQRDRNHPSVIVWSLGNESGYGANHDAAAGWVRHADPSRPLHYEGAIMFGWSEGAAASDLVCPMYPPIDAIVGHATSGTQTRPLIMCEFSHAMGNSNGTLAEYWDAIEATPGLQGGFIWEFWDHGLEQTLPDGTVRWAYGGDFGDVPNDGNFVTDGMVFPDRTPKPAMWEHLALASPVRLAPGGEALGQVRLTNCGHWRDTAWLTGEWHLLIDGPGASVAAGSAPADLPVLAAGQEAVVAVPGALLRLLEEHPDGEAWLTLDLALAGDEAWGPAGTRVATPQVQLRAASPMPITRHPAADPAAAAATTEQVDVEQVDVDEQGFLRHRALAAPPRLSLWRAPTDNDRIGGFAARWQAMGLREPERTLVEVVRGADGAVVVRSRYALAQASVDHQQVVRPVSTPFGSGLLVEEEAVVPAGVDDLPRVGTVFEVSVPEDMRTASGSVAVDWFGRGPWETYPDRCRAGSIGRFGWDVAGWHTPYIRPQENGGRNGVRWLSVAGVTLAMDRPRQVNLSHYRDVDLADATHHEELTAEPGMVVVHLDAAHRGLGTASCGPDTLQQYRFGAGTYRWSWLITSER